MLVHPWHFAEVNPRYGLGKRDVGVPAAADDNGIAGLDGDACGRHSSLEVVRADPLVLIEPTPAQSQRIRAAPRPG